MLAMVESASSSPHHVPIHFLQCSTKLPITSIEDRRRRSPNLHRRYRRSTPPATGQHTLFRPPQITRGLPLTIHRASQISKTASPHWLRHRAPPAQNLRYKRDADTQQLGDFADRRPIVSFCEYTLPQVLRIRLPVLPKHAASGPINRRPMNH